MSNIKLQDGDTIIIESQDGPTVWDPLAECKIVRSYRVLAVKSGDPVLKLIPIGPAVLECGSK